MSGTRLFALILVVTEIVGLYTFAAIYFRKDIIAWLRKRLRKDD